MKFVKRMKAAMLLLILLCILCVNSVLAKDAKEKQEKGEEVKILFTHDIHSHLDTFKVKKGDGETKEVGGFARMKTMIAEKRKENPDTLVVDAGDFSMGTLYQTISETEAPELTLMGKMGFDVTTLGNHEFDYRSKGISNMLNVAAKNKKEDAALPFPELVSANIDWEKNTDKEDKEFKDALENYGSKSYVILERNGVKIGVYGVLGEEAEDYAPESGIDFDNIVDTSKEIVKQLKDEGAELIICLSHSGTNEDKSKSEDELLAEKVPEIDVIVSGHSHTKLDEYIKVGDTYVVSSGRYGEFLGEIDLVPSGDRWKVKNYKMNRLDNTVPADDTILAELETYKKDIDETYLKRFGYTFDQVLAENSVEFTQMDDFGLKVEEDPLGSIISDSYIYAVQQAEGENYKPVAAAFAPSGTIRDTLQKGEITVSDAFNVCSLGIGADRIVGYPLVSVYLTGKELRTAAEIDVSVSPVMTVAQLYPSGVKWTYNSNRMILNRVTEVMLDDGVSSEELDNDKLYRVVAGLYSAQMLSSVEDASMGLLKITPKDKDGNPVKDFEEHIIYDRNGAEVKEWYALASYLDSFDENESGISEIPDRYEKAEGRKVDTDSKNIMELLKSPNKFFFIICGIVLLVIAIIVLLVRWIVRWYTKRRAKKRKDR